MKRTRYFQTKQELAGFKSEMVNVKIQWVIMMITYQLNS